MELDDFVKEHIVEINAKITDFKKDKGREFNDVDIKNNLQNKLKNDIKNPEVKLALLSALKNQNYVKAKIENIANEFVYYEPHLKEFYEYTIFSNIFKELNINDLTDILIEDINRNEAINKNEFKFIQNDLKKLITKSLYVASQGGFSSDLQSSDMGLRVANEGDSAQFLFIARAILAGFNCSNVDVRSSRYDAIIDYNSTLLRIQIKGITDSSNISFFDRDRGGLGIDYTHERNKGKRITKEDCDIYVAVDKQVGICYIVPMSFTDNLNDEDAKKVKLEDIEIYKENWKVVYEVANLKATNSY